MKRKTQKKMKKKGQERVKKKTSKPRVTKKIQTIYGPFADWKNPNEYPDHKKTPGYQWAWEFLRRNPEYQRDYCKWLACSNGKPVYSPDEIRHHAVDKWGIREMKNPLEKRAGQFLFHKSGLIWFGDRVEAANVNEMACKFKLTLPIAPQLEQVKRDLTALQKEARMKSSADFSLLDKRKQSTLPDYLRLLDAIADGAGTKERAQIFSHLGAPQQGIFRARNKAFEWCKNYRDFLFLG
ncbi:hypothetical protein UR09_03960 [Candidatus Nitromaritima sp. SCGC AAA799-A02]|nr:hypothetical protein UR09_03960 [Candidatus Nitromaritima sp. SCGC AAA799-A02]